MRMFGEKDKEFEEEVKAAVKKGPGVEMPGLAEPRTSPPVFVKVERYKDLLGDIQQLRSYSLGMRDSLDAMGEIEKELKAAMNLTNKVLDKLNMIISSLDMKLLRRGGPLISPGTKGGAEPPVKPPPEVEEHIKEIYEQIEKLKGELQTVG
jgi:hypothetical protein